MPTENKGGIPDKDKNFVAPDESKLVEDPVLAEAMAHGSNTSRSQEAKLRKSAAAYKAQGDSVLAQKRYLSAETAAWMADGQEEWAGIEHKVSQMDADTLMARRNQLIQEEIEVKAARKATADTLSLKAIDLHERLELIHVELSAIEKRLTE